MIASQRWMECLLFAITSISPSFPSPITQCRTILFSGKVNVCSHSDIDLPVLSKISIGGIAGSVFSQTPSFEVANFPNLTTLEISNNCLLSCTSFSLSCTCIYPFQIALPSLQTLTIGENCCNSQSDDGLFQLSSMFIRY